MFLICSIPQHIFSNIDSLKEFENSDFEEKIEINKNFNLDLQKLDGGLVVTKDNVVLDGDGYVINSKTKGIDLSNRKNVTICNFEIKSSAIGIFLKNTSYCRILNNTIYSSEDWVGIYLFDSNNNLISGNSIEECHYGIQIDQESCYNDINENNIINNQNGINIGYFSPGNRIFNNQIVRNINYGIGIFGGLYGSQTKVFRNEINENGFGITLSLVSNNFVYENNFSHNFIGLKIEGSSNNIFSDNILNGNIKNIEFIDYVSHYEEVITSKQNIISNIILSPIF